MRCGRGERYMIRCRADEPVFDLATDRYLEYDRDRPADSRAALLEGLRQTLGNERTDSPVFLLLPSLPAPSYDQFAAGTARLPGGGRSGREQASGSATSSCWPTEVRGFEWESVGLRHIGRAQFECEAYDGARVTWEAVREIDGDRISRPICSWGRSTSAWVI